MKYEKWLVGENIRRMRKAKNMAVVDVAVEIDKSESHLGQIECGAKGFSLELLYKLTEVLDTDANTLLGFKGLEDDRFLEFKAVYDLLDGETQEYLIPLFLNIMRDTIQAKKVMEV